MGVLNPWSAQAGPSARRPIDTSRNFSEHHFEIFSCHLRRFEALFFKPENGKLESLVQPFGIMYVKGTAELKWVKRVSLFCNKPILSYHKKKFRKKRGSIIYEEEKDKK